MSFTIHKRDFLDVIQKAFPIVQLKSSLQILLNFRLKFSPDCLEIHATDLDHSIMLKNSINGEGEYDITINAKKLLEIVRELHEDDLTIDIHENVLNIESGGSFSCKIAGGDSRDFPSFPETDNYNEIDISVNNLTDMIIKSSFAVSKDDSRACLCGVYWEIEKNRTGMVATDGHRLGSSFYDGEYNTNGKIVSIISPKTLIHLVRILETEDNDKTIHVSISDKYILFTNEELKLCSKLIEGLYPDYKNVIPKDNPKEAIIDKNTLLEAVRRVSVLSNQKTHLIKFNFKDKELEIVVLNRDIGGEARQIIPINYKGEDHIIGFNGSYLSEILSIIKTQTIRIEMNTQISACLLYPYYKKEEDKKSEDLYLIMPLRILDEY